MWEFWIGPIVGTRISSMMPVTTDGGRLTPEQMLTSELGVATACAMAGGDIATVLSAMTLAPPTRSRRSFL